MTATSSRGTAHIGSGDYDEQALRAAQISRYAERTPINVGATAFNTLLFSILLFPTAPRLGLLTWATLQLCTCGYQFVSWLRRPSHIPRGSRRGIRRIEWMATLAGCLWGCSVFLLDGANELQRAVVLVSNVAMVSGAATTLVSIPNAARGYIIGTLSLCIVAFLIDGHREEVVLAGLALSLMLFLLRSSTQAHRSFMEELRLSQSNEQRISRFRAELGEWLDMSHSTEAFALLDESDRLLLWNHHFEEIYASTVLERGLNYDTLLRQSVAPVLVNGKAQDKEYWMQLRKTLSAESEPLVEEYEQQTWKRVTTARGASSRRVVLIVDVTSLKLAQLALQERDATLARTQRLETVGTLAGGVAHDFNNMLTAIQGFAELLRMEVNSHSGREAIAEIQQCVARGTALTRQLLAYGRCQTLNPRPIDLAELLDGLQRLIQQLLPATVRFSTRVDALDGMVEADPGQLEQVVLNLVINARDAMPNGGSLTIDISQRGSDAIICVSDTGTGMDRETQEKAFEPFFTTKQLHLGSGLGLAVSHGIIRQSGGEIEVESELGKGTLFRIRLPLIQGAAKQTRALATNASPQLGCGELVLLVDDDEMVRRATGEALKRLGYRVIASGSPVQAVQLWQAQRGGFDLVLTDVVMPEMNGTDLIQQLFALQNPCAVVYMTGYDAGALSNVGDEEVLSKPFTELRLAQALRKALLRVPTAAVSA